MRKFFLLLAVVLAFSSLGLAQAKDEPKTIAQVLDGGVKTIESEFVPAAEAMPEDKYGFAPTNGEFTPPPRTGRLRRRAAIPLRSQRLPGRPPAPMPWLVAAPRRDRLARREL